MQNPIFSNPKLRDWIVTLVALSFTTILLVLNLPHITKFGPSIRAFNDRMWSALYKGLIVRSGLRAQLSRFSAQLPRHGDTARAEDSDVEGEDGIELIQRNQHGTEPGDPVMTGAIEPIEVV
jgi:hypothetical protein